MTRPLIAVIGDGNTDENNPKFLVALELGQAIIDHGYRLVTGGMAGVMGAASKGAHRSEKYREGDVIGILPHYNPKVANTYVDIPIATGFGIARNIIVANSSAVIAVGGGSGTLSEMAFAWQLKRLILSWKGDGWSGELADQKLDQRVRYQCDWEDRVFGFDSAVEAMKLLETYLPHYQNWG